LKNKTQRFDKLLVCERRYGNRRKLTLTSSDLKYIRSFDNTSTFDDESYNLIITRRDSCSRKILNLEELHKSLDCKNLKIVSFSNMCIHKQMFLVRNSQNIIGTNGSNLTNTIFANNSNIIEIYNNKLPVDIVYNHIADALDNDYHRIKSPTILSDYYIDRKTLDDIKNSLIDKN